MFQLEPVASGPVWSSYLGSILLPLSPARSLQLLGEVSCDDHAGLLLAQALPRWNMPPG